MKECCVMCVCDGGAVHCGVRCGVIVSSPGIIVRVMLCGCAGAPWSMPAALGAWGNSRFSLYWPVCSPSMAI